MLLFEAAMEPQGIEALLNKATPYMIALLAYLQRVSARDRADSRERLAKVEAAREEDARRITALEVHNAELRTHVGVDGNGLTQQMQDLIGEVRGLRGDMSGVVQELAEHRGAARRGGDR